ncbi:MAG: PEP-CTERM sorting domain-containing protein [Caulobacterales bacterium]|nr:PEP-CTERM sorting domain-containing protein [Caulobacterales bacterium]
MRFGCGIVAGALLLLAASEAQALQIVPTFDSSITSRADAADVEATIVAATQFYRNFSDPVDVSIYFRLGDTSLGRSVTTLYASAYADYTFGLGFQAALHPENAVLQSAVANLPYGNVGAAVIFSSANLNALVAPFGIAYPGVVDGGFDGEVMLSDAPGKVVFSGPVGAGQYDAFAVIQHEIDEVLGAGGGGSALTQPFGAPGSGLIEALDLDRYDGFHSPNYTYDPNAQPYFSYDGGATNYGYFNQDPRGDYGDFAKNSCGGPQRVQDWFSCSGVPRYGLTRNSVEVLELQAIGYNLSATPEPSTWAAMLLGLGLVGAILRRRLVQRA